MTVSDPLPGLIGVGGGPMKPPSPNAARRPSQLMPETEALAAGAELSETEATWQDLRERLPEKVALLKVIPHKRADGTECFQLEMYSHHGMRVAKDAAALSRQERPDLVLADKLVGEVSLSVAEECYDELLDPGERPELTEWLTDLRQGVGDNLQLIIWDDTDFGIVWELFWHDMDGMPAWLGTTAEIIRWVTVRTPERRRQFSAEKDTAVGSQILYFEDPALLPTRNYSILDPLKKSAYVDGKSMKGLLNELDDEGNAGRFGLVYIRGHGRHGNQRNKAMLADVSLLKVSGLQLNALRKSKALVFLNACNSARPVPDKGPGDNISRNFAEVFLRRHAVGVIATLAEVGAGYSASLPSKLVTLAHADGVRIPAFLRDERAKEARGLPGNTLNLSDDDRKKILSFLRVSVFAYFGHPESIFKLVDP